MTTLNEDEKGTNVCRFTTQNYVVNISIDNKKESLEVDVAHEKGHTRYFKSANEKDLGQAPLVLFRIFELFAAKSKKVKLEIIADDDAVHLSVNFTDSILSAKYVLMVEEVVQSKQDAILFKLDQMEKAHQSQLSQLQALLQLHENVVLLPGSSKVIAVTAAKLTLDGRNAEIILNSALKKIADEKDDNDEEVNYQKLMPTQRTNFANYTNINNDPTILANLQSLNIEPKECNGCHSCGYICQCHYNHYYCRNKLLMVTTEAVRKLDDHLAAQLNDKQNQARRFQAELGDALRFCMDPEFVSFNGANITALTRLRCITEITIHFNDNIEDISPLAQLESLLLLHIVHCGRVQEVDALAALFNLRSLSFYQCPKVFDLTKLGNLAKLTFLDVRGTRVVNITMFGKFPELRVECDEKK